MSKVLIFLKILGEGRDGLIFSWSRLTFLCSICIHWNKTNNNPQKIPHTRPFMCLESVTDHLPLNMRNPLSCPFYPHIQEIFRNCFILCSSQLIPPPWFSVPFLFSLQQEKFCFLQGSSPPRWLHAALLGQGRAWESWWTKFLIIVQFPIRRALVTN